MHDELIEELRRHHCDAKEDDTQEVCEECAYDVIIADKSVPSGIASVCVCGLMNRAADAIEELQAYVALYKDLTEKSQKVATELKQQLQKSEVDNTNLTGWLAEEHAKHLWVPVAERLPEAGERVLCYCRANIYEVMKMRTDGDWVYDTNHVYMRSFVTHWMPLPEPPESEGEHG